MIIVPNIVPTKQTLSLVHALEEQGLKVHTEYWDGHKHVDIFIPDARMCIEIDGLQHFINPDQIIADFEREYYSSKDGIYTIHITNQLIESHLNEIATAITRVAKKGRI